MDDVAYDKRVLQTQTQRCLALNARHYKVTVFNTTQYAMSVPPVIRANIDYVIALRDTTVANRKKLYEHYYGCFSSFQQFEQVFQAVTANFGALVLDRTAASGRLEDQIRWYQADVKAKPCRILQQSFWDIAAMDLAIGWKDTGYIWRDMGARHEHARKQVAEPDEQGGECKDLTVRLT